MEKFNELVVQTNPRPQQKKIRWLPMWKEEEMRGDTWKYFETCGPKNFY